MRRKIVCFCAIGMCALLVSCSGEQEKKLEQHVRLDVQVNKPTETGPEVDDETHVSSSPESTKSDMWKYVVNNALRTADEYATERNPNAVFVGLNVEVDFIKQYGGEFEGRYLLTILNQHGGNTSFAMLLPLFDENSTSQRLDDEGELWRVVVAKHNGREF